MNCCQVVGCLNPQNDLGLLQVDIRPGDSVVVVLCRGHRQRYEAWFDELSESDQRQPFKTITASGSTSGAGAS